MSPKPTPPKKLLLVPLVCVLYGILMGPVWDKIGTGVTVFAIGAGLACALAWLHVYRFFSKWVWCDWCQAWMAPPGHPHHQPDWAPEDRS